MSKHAWWMILACILPLLLIFLFPLFGVFTGGGVLLFVFIIACFGLHLLLMRGMHGNGGDGGEKGDRHGAH